MRIKFCLGFAGLWLAFLPGWAGADVSENVEFCLIQGAPRDKLSPDLTCGTAQRVALLTTRDDSNKPYWTTHTGVTRAVIVVNAAGASPVFQSISTGLGTLTSDERVKTWLVALQFATGLASGRNLRWSVVNGEKGYLLGNASTAPGNAQVSSFELVDQFVLKMKAWAPNITEFVIVGFGENAEFVNRYSIGTTVESQDALKGNATVMPAIPAASVRYLMVSAGRYTYLNSTQALANTTRYQYTPGVFENFMVGTKTWKHEKQPTLRTVTPTTCTPHHDSYPYGFTATPADHYMTSNRDDNKRRVTGKQRLFLVGSTDTQTTLDNYLTSAAARCPAQQQGAHRVERVFTYMHHLRQEKVNIAPAGMPADEVSLASNAGFCIVDGKGYNGAAMLGSLAATLYWKYGMVHCAFNDPPY